MSEAVYPNDWQERRLTGLANYHNGLAFKPADWSEDGVRIIRIEQLNNPEGDYDHFNGFFPDANAINDGDLIFSWSATLKVSIWRYGKAVLNQHLFKVVPKPGFDKRYLYFLLDFHMDTLSAGSHGSTMKHIKRGELEKYPVRLPSQREQEKIAEVLATIDSAIEKTEALIAKYQQIKAGLMHDLFTRGVTADGKLRAPREQAPELYYEMPIGWIPKEWEVGSLAKFLIGGPKNGYSPPEVSEWSGVFSLGLGCLTASGFRPRQIKVVSGTSDAACAAIVNDGDLLLSRSNTRELVGLCGIYRDIGGTCIYPDLMMRIKPNAKTSTAYLEAFLLTPKMRIQITAAAVGTSVSMVKLNSKSVLRLEISMPKPDEQLQILRIIEAQRSQLESFEKELFKLRQQKSGLMSDLLTSRVRVKLAETEVVSA